VTAGLPGAGIGGLFYLLAALLMPLVELGRWLAGAGRGRGHLVWRQFFTASLILAVIAATAYGVTQLIAWHGGGLGIGSSSPTDHGSHRVVTRAMVFLTLGTLAAVLVSVELMAACVSLRKTVHRHSDVLPKDRLLPESECGEGR
jgi:hypothetical protein